MHIRPETPADYAALARLNVRAFKEEAVEATLVALLRQHPNFNPAFSLVAEENGQIVGHALFVMYRVKIMDEWVWAANLAPLAVDPDFQKRGIGGALITEGHRVVREHGCVFSLLLGHTSYYPRFGYRKGMFGVSSVTVRAEDVRPAAELTTRSPRESDVMGLVSLGLYEEHEVDFTLAPSHALLEWLSPDARMRCEVYERDGELVGYTRVRSSQPDTPAMFYARDSDAAHAMAARLMQGMPQITLPLHPNSASAAAFPNKPNAVAWQAAMACPLVPGVLDDYTAQLESGVRPPGRPLWPSAFDVA